MPGPDTRGAVPHLRAVLLVVAFILVAGCAVSDGDDRKDDPDRLSKSGVGIIAEGCGLAAQTGSGVVLAERHQVVTVAHAVAGASKITVVDDSGTELDATIEAFDKDSDLAVLHVNGLDADPLAVGTLELGLANAVVWSRNEGVRAVPIEINKKLNITIEDIYVEDEVRRTGMELRGEISSGDSGGAVINSDADVVGIIYARSRTRPGVAFATDSAELARLLRERPMDPIDRCF
mgnify:FL=1